MSSSDLKVLDAEIDRRKNELGTFDFGMTSVVYVILKITIRPRSAQLRDLPRTNMRVGTLQQHNILYVGSVGRFLLIACFLLYRTTSRG